eukprot:806444-Rhodomonas_salina.1
MSQSGVPKPHCTRGRRSAALSAHHGCVGARERGHVGRRPVPEGRQHDVMDLSEHASRQLGFVSHGIVRCTSTLGSQTTARYLGGVGGGTLLKEFRQAIRTSSSHLVRAESVPPSRISLPAPPAS